MKTTRQKYEGECGLCMSCKEWTPLLDPCCGGSVLYEGGTINTESLMEEIEAEENEQHRGF